MKTRLLRSCLTALIMLVTTASYAYDAYIDGIYYRFIGSYATVTYLDKTYSGNEFAYTGDIVIPNSVSYNGNTYNVIGIDEYAFNYCKYLTNVTIPASVKNIGRAAFSGCSNLSTVSIPEGVKSIPIEAFRSCSNLTSITIPESVTSIATFAFYSCYNLKEARFASIESLCRIAFADGSANPLGQAHHLYIGDNDDEITEITIPNSCSSIGAYTFHGCSGITSITIPEGITNIGSHAFDQCSGLTCITIPQSVTNIGTAAFLGCSGLTDIAIPQNVKNIGSSAFGGCKGLTSIAIPEGVTILGDAMFMNCSNLYNITIPKGVTTIGTSAFRDCSNLVSISIPECVSSIGSDTFWGCSSLKSVTIGSGIESIGVRAFRNCHITEMYCHAIEVPQTDSSTFQQTEIEKATLYVPQVSLESYKNVAPWSNFKEILAIEDSPAIKYDANGDGHITIADVNLIIDYLLKH